MRKSLVVIFLLSMLSTQAQELNFWQKGEAFFTLKAKGLKPGRYQVLRISTRLTSISPNRDSRWAYSPVFSEWASM